MNKTLLFHTVSSFLMTWALQRVLGISTFSVLTLACFILFFVIFRKKTAFNMETTVFSLLFTLFTMAGSWKNICSGLDSAALCAAFLLISAAGLFLIFYNGLFRLKELSLPSFTSEKHFIKTIYIPVILLICWLPWLFLNFPGVMTVDSLNQYGQIIGELPLSDHHPLVHTLLFGCCYNIGTSVFGSQIAGIAVFTLFQLLIMSAIITYICHTIKELLLSPLLQLIILLFYALLPINGLYMVTLWKDIMFSGVCALFTCCILRLILFPESRKKLCLLLYFISALFMCLLRSNGLYAVVFTLPFLLFSLRKNIKSLLPVSAAALLSAVLIKLLLFSILNPAQPDFVESLSVPVQMTARVYADEEATEDWADEAFSKIMDISGIKAAYYPFCSDHMKNLIRLGDEKYLEEHKAEFLGTWLRFGLSHPLAYLRGYIDETSGYYFPDTPENALGLDAGIAPNNYGLADEPLLKGAFFDKLREIIFKLHGILPLYGLLYSLGFFTWAALLLFYMTKGQLRLCFLPSLGVMLTLLVATPVYNEFRYGYPLLLSLPVLAAAALHKASKE